jgi:D-beta-D-heptose 7-phosphate kinase/D-beta-D-heptose 1-phosphate adenosyltransferase
VQIKPTYETRGGAGLVAAQLKEFVGEENVIDLYGSVSRKERYFADDRLMFRVDYDSIEIHNQPALIKVALEKIKEAKFVVFSDYSKGGVSPELIRQVLAASRDKTVFVDAKINWDLYKGANFLFPNRKEAPDLNTGIVIRKLGADGCSVNGDIIPTDKNEVKDTTGAGDIFLAAFVAAYYRYFSIRDSAVIANKMASESVRHIGTNIVSKEKFELIIDEVNKNDKGFWRSSSI